VRLSDEFEESITDSGGGTLAMATRQASLWSWSALAVPLLIVVGGAVAYIWVQEDAFINFRIIENFLAGHGPVYNVGERVEAYSDPLWLFLLAGIHGVVHGLSLEWLSVILGITGTVTGVVLAGRAIQQLGVSRGEPIVLPIGLLIFSVVAGVWEFTTGGLEMGMVFAWMGASVWLLVRLERQRSGPVPCAFIMGLGTLVRPELAIMSAVFLMGWAVVVGSPGWKGSRSPTRRWILPVLAALALPVLYELFRMAYFGLLVANTALAKSGTGAWWSQGFTYLWNFVDPYWLWVPFALAVPLTVPRLVRWWRSGDYPGATVLMIPAVAGLADLIYVVHVGGDYMHARLLLPAFFALSLPLFVGTGQLRGLSLVPLVGILVWAIACAGWLRFDVGNAAFGVVHGIANERNVWIAADHKAHPIVPGDYLLFDYYGLRNRSVAAANERSHRQALLVQPAGFAPVTTSDYLPAESPLPFSLAVNTYNIGADGLVSGPRVYMFDTLSLANPIGSHMTIVRRGRPGHEKSVGPVWMIARFGRPGADIARFGISPQELDAARHALHCGSLNTYLHAITTPFSLSQGWQDVLHSWTNTTMSFSADPEEAERTLCRS